MMKVLTGEIINTRFGELFIYNEQNMLISVGEPIMVNGAVRKIKAIWPPSKPDAKWSVELES